MSNDSDARANRGSGNQCSKAWYDAPLWKNVGPAARKKEIEKDVYNATEVSDNVKHEDEIKARMKRAYSFAY